MVVAYVPQKMKGTPSGKPLTPQEIQDSIGEDLDFEQTRVSTNEYLLENNVHIRLRLMLTRVGKTDLFNPDGSPLYGVQTQIVHEIKVPKGFGKGKEKKKSKGTPIV